MRKILFLIVFISGSLFAQNEAPNLDKSTYNKILIGLSVSPDYTYRTLLSDGSASSDAIHEYRNETEKAKIGYTLGLNFNYNFSRKFGLRTGVLFSNKGYQTDLGGLIFGDQTPRRSFEPVDPNDPSLPARAKNIYNHYYLDIPLKVTYKMGKGKIRFISSLGITTNILIKSTVKTIFEYQNGDKNKSTNSAFETYNQLNFSPIISFGIESSLKNNHIIRIEPSFNYGLLKIINSPVTAKLWSAGINFSYYFGLKKNLN